uniref:Methionine sulfoxide reductase B1 n=1 Tax=Chrysemys picta bellii TaxID=8478 RepID=A0A8C3I8E1_CHRPI
PCALSGQQDAGVTGAAHTRLNLPPEVNPSFLLSPSPGIYVCSKCGYELFSSKAKYQHSSPWPAFTETIHADSVAKYEERPGALKVSCGKCGNGLGHEFLNDGLKRGQSRF